MKYIGLDYGTRKCGLAVSDDRGMVAVPWKIVPTGELKNELAEMLQNKKFKKIVVGESVKNDGTHNEVFKEVQKFVVEFENEYKAKFESGELEVICEKEFFSSKHARSEDRAREVDDRAAALILQRYLDKQNLKNRTDEELEEDFDL